jgi:leucyl aminopeptidase
MNVIASTESAAQINCSALVVFTYEGALLSGSAADANTATNGLLQRLYERGEIDGKLGRTSLLHDLPGLSARSLLVVGAGVQAKFDAGAAFRLGGTALKRLADRPRDKVVFDWNNVDPRIATSGICGAINGCVGQDLFRAEKNLKPIGELVCCGATPAAVERGVTVGEGMLLTRELVNLPPNYMYPESFALRAKQVADACGLELEIWDELRLRKENCNALLAVNSGSSRPARLLILRYRGNQHSAAARTNPLALVGKGVTFDSGGLSIKPTEGMTTMKCDMAGAATVLGTMQTIAKLKLDMPVVGLVGLVENMISGTSFKLGDVLTARSGKTIEILNTDAEGRLVLADVLNVTLQEKPCAIVDLATLTGACVVALGLDIAGLMTNSESLCDQIESAARKCGEMVWPLPMHAHFTEQIQSQIADIKNIGEGRWGGAITAAKFLEEFVEGTPWTHIDIAGPAFSEKPKGHMDSGATGCLVRTLIELVENWQ